MTLNNFSKTYSHSLSSLNFFSKAFLYLSNLIDPYFKISGSNFDHNIYDHSLVLALIFAYDSYKSCNFLFIYNISCN